MEADQLIARTHFWTLKYFKYDHLPEHLQAASKLFYDTANAIVHRFIELEACGSRPDPVETEEGLRKLLEAKDCIVRSLLL